VAHIPVEAEMSNLNVELQSDGRVRVGDTVFIVEDLGNGEWHIVADGRAVRIWAAGPRERPWIYAGGVVYRPALGSGRAAGPHRDDHASLSAPMPATVRAVLVAAGQAVARGDTLVILEAMKMELPLRAPHDGVVKAIACEPGELVQPGTQLVEIE
jgi:acetyl/propionyl-CoA carboxylase alpha subunit